MKPSGASILAIESSDLFDASWYVDRYHDVALVNVGAAEHYLRIGADLHRDPGPRFSTAHYLAMHPDVAGSGENPLLHYIRHGRAEGRACLPSQANADGVDLVSIASTEATVPQSRWREFRGRLGAKEDARKVLVCAHVAGRHLYGGERSLLDILDGFVGAGHDVVVAMPGVGNLEYVEALRDRCIAAVSFPYGWWREGKPVDEGVVATFANLIESYGINAVHANTIMLREPLHAARRMGIPAVVHVRELISHDTALRELIGEAPERVIAQVLDSADWVIANSEATARAFSKPGATLVVPNTVDMDAMDGPAAAMSDPIRIGMVSSNLPKKGILDFVAVANLLEDRLPDARFLLIGPENLQTQALRDEQSKGSISRNIVFAGYRDDPASAMAELDILVNLSHFQESFGRTVLEAMAARRPVVVYDWGALPELVDDGRTGHVVPFKDVAAVAERLEAMCADGDAIRSMGEAARGRVEALYAKPHYIARLSEAYHRIFSAVSQPARLTLPARDVVQGDASASLRIAYFLWHFPVPSETFVLNELRILVAQGHDVEVFCRQSPHEDFEPDFPIQWTRVTDAADLARRLRQSARTIVHSHFTYPTVTEMVWPACEEAEVPFTFIAHAQDIFRHANDEKNQIGRIGRSPWCLRVIVPSRFHRDYVEARGVPASKLLINPNGVDPELYAAARTADRARRTERSICAIHRFTAKKGLDQLIRAAAPLADDGVSIHLYGYGELEDEYRILIEELRLSNVSIHGPVRSRDQMLAVFRKHDLFACPSVRAPDGDMDGIPTVLMEAMASGLPVLSTGISGIPDLVRDGITGIVSGDGVDALVAAVRRYYSLPDPMVAAIIADAEAHVSENFNAARLTATLVRLWRRRTIDIMIVSWNNLPQLREVMSRLHCYTSLPCHFVVCDNGSEADVGAFLCREYAEHDNLTVVFNRENALVGPGTNICLQQGASDYAVYVCGKEGFVLDYGWDKSFVEYMDASPDVGLAGTLCHSPSYLTGAKYPEGIALFPKFRNQSFATDNPDRRFGHVQGGFFVMRRAMYEAIGGFSTDVPHSYTDVEYSYYAESTGWKLGTPPRLLALFNKTRPGLFSRIDEHVAATHPPELEDLPLLDRIAQGKVAHCNVCGWHGDAFAIAAPGTAACPACGSRPADRSLYRFLAESMLTYRRLPALGVGVGEAIEGIWRHQFQGTLMTPMHLDERLRIAGTLDFKTDSLKLVYFNGLDLGDAPGAEVLRELDRVLAPDGVLLVHVPVDEVPRFEVALGLSSTESVRYSSRVVHYDCRPLFVGRRCDPSYCVS